MIVAAQSFALAAVFLALLGASLMVAAVLWPGWGIFFASVGCGVAAVLCIGLSSMFWSHYHVVPA